jgi:hypothetical protein
LRAPEPHVEVRNGLKEPIIVYHQLKPSFDLLNFSEQILKAIREIIDETDSRQQGSAAELYESIAKR